MGLINARNRLLNNSNRNLPNMSNTITKWFLNISFQEVIRTQDGADWVEEDGQIYNTKGVVQPPRDEDLQIYPMGCWSWQWQMLHCLPEIQLTTNQYIKYDGVTYKVMSKKDWGKYGYVRYMLLEAYQADNL